MASLTASFSAEGGLPDLTARSFLVARVCQSCGGSVTPPPRAVFSFMALFLGPFLRLPKDRSDKRKVYGHCASSGSSRLLDAATTLAMAMGKAVRLTGFVMNIAKPASSAR